MFNNKNKVVPTPPYNHNDLGNSVGWAYLPNIHPTSILPVQGGRTIPKNYKCGFTLAEVLITLVIIGVIAAMTVPTLINKTNNQEYVSRLKKAYSTLAQATNKIIAKEGPVTTWATSRENIYNLYKLELKNAKECGTEAGCFEMGAYTKLNGGHSGVWDENADLYKLILADGTQICFDDFSEQCILDNVVHNGSIETCLIFEVDINGYKKPNIIGRDLFEFVLKKNGLYPAGCDIDDLCVNTESGYACACKVLREGAMNY